MIRDALLATGVLFATFTQLRPSGSPFGVGELCLAAWVGLTFLHCIFRLDGPMPIGFRSLLMFWVLFAAALCIGTMNTIVRGEEIARGEFRHDLGAYALVASVSLLAVFQADAAARLRRVTWLLVLVGSGALALQLSQAFGLLPRGGIDFWFYHRLTGWTTNSNQLGLMCLILVLLAFHLAETAPRLSKSVFGIAGAVLPIWVGYLTGSDAFLLALAIILLCYVGLKFCRTIGARQKRPSLLTVSMVFAVPILLATTAPLIYALSVDRVSYAAHDGADERIKRDIGYRTELLAQAMQRGVESRMLGLGPGPHLFRPADLREPEWYDRPNFEAHNTIADMFLQGGLFAVICLIWLAAAALLRTLKADLSCLPLLILGLSIFGVTHFILRHPSIWFVLALAMTASPRSESRRTAGSVSRTFPTKLSAPAPPAP